MLGPSHDESWSDLHEQHGNDPWWISAAFDYVFWNEMYGKATTSDMSFEVARLWIHFHFGSLYVCTACILHFTPWRNCRLWLAFGEEWLEIRNLERLQSTLSKGGVEISIPCAVTLALLLTVIVEAWCSPTMVVWLCAPNQAEIVSVWLFCLRMNATTHEKFVPCSDFWS